MLWPERWPPTLGNGPACWSASPRVPPGGMTTPSLSCASARKLRPFKRKLDDLPVLDDVADFGGGRLQQRHVHFDRHLLRQPLDTQREVQRHRPADFEYNVLDLWRESRMGDGDLPFADAECRKEEPPGVVGDATNCDTARGVPRGHCHPRNDGAGSVSDNAADFGSVGLSAGHRHEQAQQQDDAEGNRHAIPGSYYASFSNRRCQRSTPSAR